MKKKGQQKKNNTRCPGFSLSAGSRLKKTATWRSELSTYGGKWVKFQIALQALN